MASLPPLLIDLPRNPLVAVGIPVGLGIGTGLLTRNGTYGPNSLWYKSLNKPRFDPPKWAFGVVWPTLYAAMGWSSHLLVKALDRTPSGLGRQRALRSLSLYYIQLALNQSWTPLNFGFGSLGFALLDITALTSTIFVWLDTARHVDERVLWLNLPYAIWSTYATYLNGSLWWQNGGAKVVQDLVGRVMGKSKGQ
ncbi:TspO/MBR-related protein [Jaminaea rosea]|uniref:TspO/MBR-related protein n=1 Tax=Jaminaea rosea TaxID=1569628 RepID=A0A316UKS9_9BASI|nr:TspO/MBR-related protein [Jaminaea rosea]PWN25840.1 TspO/MBR-related protein [Jaminaea rosea]